MPQARAIGQILREDGRITGDQVSEVLGVQKKQGEKRLFGQIAVSRGYAKSVHVKVALAKQQKERGG